MFINKDLIQYIMADIPTLLEKANKLFEVADHLTYVTYPMVKEPKLIFTITEHILNSCVSAMDALLYYEYTYKRIDSYQNNNFMEKINIFKYKVAPRYGIDRKHIFIMEDLKMILDRHKKSPVEFSKNNSIIMCNPNYEVTTITIEKVKNYVYESKNFLNKVNSLLKTQNARRH